jgi:4-amino-4-deoxy-L-arabinose transferase-like glycosyltransferase
MIKRISRFINWNLIILLVMLAAGLGLRLLNLTNPPLDFHADRQLYSAIVARGMYYQMLPNIDPAQKQLAISLWKAQDVYEPPILERIVALTYYLVGSEQLWIARIYSAMFWMIGGLALYGLAKRMTSVGGGLAALAFYLFVPLGVYASRAFQPNSFMVMWMLLALYVLFRWSEDRTWKWTLLTGLLAGMAILVKVFAAAMLAPALVAMVLSTIGFRNIVRNRQIWSMAVISIAIPAAYYLISIGTNSAGFIDFWVLSYTNMLFQPRFYFAWLGMAGSLVGISTIFFSLAGLMLISGKGKTLALGLWLGYGLFGLLVPIQISTHDYYSLSLIPIVALSLAALFSLVKDNIKGQLPIWRGFAIMVAILAIAISAWLARNGIVASDYAPEAKGWTQLGAEMPRDGRIIALTHDYGTRLSYFGFIKVDLWPYVADYSVLAQRNGEQGNGQPAADTFEQYFRSKTDGYKYFLVTLFNELDAQPLLKRKLYETYPIFQQGSGYILFDLDHPLMPTQQP